jgi:hypothetical protein
MADPYAGIGSPVHDPDPYAGLGTPQHGPDPYAGIGAPPAPPAPVQHAPAPGATGLGAIPQLVGDLFNPNAGQVHQPNWLEQPLVSGPIQQAAQGLRADYMNAVTHGIFMQPVRAAMEGMGVGRQPGETDQQFHQRYSQAVQTARQQAEAQVAATRVRPQPTLTSQATGQEPQPDLATRALQGAQWLGQQGAGIVANPQYFLAPGAGGSSVVGRIARAGAMNAGIGGVSDAAAQLMDMAEGDKKSFDIQQNLQSTATGALFGAGFHSAIEVAPFIKGLFAQRGMDTLPPSDPRAALNVSPLSGDHGPVLSPADQAQYRQLLQTGSVDDIKAFFNDRNGPRPSWTDVNSWVEHRDGAQPTDLVPQHMVDTVQRLLPQDIEAHRANVEQHLTGQMADWTNAPNLRVVHGPEDIADPQLRAQVMAEDARDPIRGFVDGDGNVHAFSGRIDSPETANGFLYHEALGHFGLAEKFGANLDSTLNSLMARNVNQFSRDVDKWQQDHPGAYNGDRTRAAEEVLAEQSENGQIKSTIRGAIDSMIRRFGNRMGLKMSYSDAEVKNILAMAHDAVVNGKPSAAANGFRGGPNKFMFTGKNATGYNPFDASAYKASDGQVRNEISDETARYIGQGDTLGQTLDHPELYRQYPELRNLPIVHQQMEGLAGQYDTGDDIVGRHIRLNPTDTDPLGTTLHETQHAIQHIEQYPDFMHAMNKGGTADMTEDAYWNHPSELEAGATEARQGLSQDERNATPPKFQRMNRDRAAGPAYEAEHLDRIYESLDKDYQKSTMSWDQTKEAALKAGFTPSQIKGLKETQAGDLAVRLHRMQAAANMVDQRLSDLDAKLDTPEWTEKDQADYVKALADFQYLTTRILDERSEIGRALQVAKMAGSYGQVNLQAIAEHMEQNGSGLAGLTDPDSFLKFARQLKTLRAGNNPAGVQKMMQNVGKPGWEDYLTSFHMNAMLSGLSTHFKAPQDMATGIGREMIERAIAVPIGKMMEPFWGKGVSPHEVAANWYGVVHAVTDLDLYRRSMEAVKNGKGQWVQPNGTVSPTHVTMATNAKNLPRIPLVSIPTDLISGQDTYFRGVSLSQNLYSLGMRQAIADLGPKALATDLHALAQTHAMSPTPKMLKEAQDLTNRTLLLNANKFNDMITSARSKMGNDFGGRLGKFVLDNIAPFIRVASNSLFTRVIERSPLAPLSSYVRGEIAAGGPRAGIALAKIAYGTALIGIYWMAADKGANWIKSITGNGNRQITGEGPENVEQYKERIAAGWRPNSVLENGRYNTPSLAASINPFDIHNTTATTVADLREAWEAGANKGQIGNAFKLTLGALVHELSSSTWINDLTPYGEALTARGQTAGQTVNQLAGTEAASWVPNALGQTARMTDPTQKLTTDNNSMGQTVINNIETHIPGMTGNVPTKYSVYGDPLASATSLTGVHTDIPGLPGNGVERTHDPAELELDRLNDSLEGLRQKDDTTWPTTLVTPVQKSFKIDQDNVAAARARGLTVDDYGKVTLTPAQFEQYQQRAGHYIVEEVRRQMSTPEWQQMSDHDRVLAIRDIVTEQKQTAREELFDPQ